MAMTPSVAAARKWHKAKECMGALTAFGVFVLLCGAFLWSAGQMVFNAWQEGRANETFRTELVAAASKSTAHHFLVSHWLQCKPILQTRATCYSSIRGTAAGSGGDVFVRQVDVATKELGLI